MMDQTRETELPDNDTVRMTFQDYDRFLEQTERLGTPVFWPSIEDVDLMEADPGKWILFACHLEEHGTPPRTKEEEYRRKTLRGFINRHLELYYDGENTGEEADA